MKKIDEFFSGITYRKQKLDKSRFSAKVVFFVLGILSTIWFLIRVIPKPSRATYPCMQAAAPFASGFIIYLMSLTTGSFLLKKSLNALTKKKILLAAGLAVAMIFAFSLTIFNSVFRAQASEQTYLSVSDIIPNDPVGEAKGLFPGRVVWVHDEDATNENWTADSPEHATDDSNLDQEIVNRMLSRGIRSLTESNTVAGAWEKLFRDYNYKHGKGRITYSEGEKIAIKLNLTNNGKMTGERVDATPQLVYAILDQLVNEAGVEQEDITIGDPYRSFSQVYQDKCIPDFPLVNYVGKNVGGVVKLTVPSSQKILKFSDGKEESSLPQHYIDAEYLINIPILKSHASGGITIGAKNHQGSVLQPDGTPTNQSALFMHYSFPDENNTPGYKKYRHLVDYMGHEQLGGKTLLYLVDGLWAGHDWRGIVRKWEMDPFNDDYPNSLFLAQDPVAIESVCYDFLLEEYKNKSTERYPYIHGTDDYLLQAADSANWPDGIKYDPEGDGSVLGSLGVYEHWNNAAEMKYTRNMGTGDGVELYKVFAGTQLPDFSGVADPANYEARKASVSPVIDGMGDEDCWLLSPWAPISIDWFEEAGMNPPSFDENDFSGRYKAVWTPDYLYLLIEITDDVLNDDINDPLDKYWDEDCVEIFIDEDNSGGEHRNSHNAWAYHTSPVTLDVVDLNTDGKPQLYNDHINFVVTSEGTIYTYEYQIKIYDDNYTDASPENARVQLEGGTTLGFSIAYCEDDGNGRENFIGTISGGMDSFKNADLFGNLTLLEGPVYKYSLRVMNGEGSGEYEENDTITVTADTPPDNYIFDGWVGDAEYLVDSTEPNTNLIMPAGSITITANYKNITGLHKEGLEELTLYPNPVSNRIFLNIPLNFEISGLAIYRLDGIQLMELDKDFESIDVSKLEQGSYIMVISNERKKISRMFTKK